MADSISDPPPPLAPARLHFMCICTGYTILVATSSCPNSASGSCRALRGTITPCLAHSSQESRHSCITRSRPGLSPPPQTSTPPTRSSPKLYTRSLESNAKRYPILAVTSRHFRRTDSPCYHPDSDDSSPRNPVVVTAYRNQQDPRKVLD